MNKNRLNIIQNLKSCKGILLYLWVSIVISPNISCNQQSTIIKENLGFEVFKNQQPEGWITRRNINAKIQQDSLNSSTGQKSMLVEFKNDNILNEKNVILLKNDIPVPTGSKHLNFSAVSKTNANCTVKIMIKGIDQCGAIALQKEVKLLPKTKWEKVSFSEEIKNLSYISVSFNIKHPILKKTTPKESSKIWIDGVEISFRKENTKRKNIAKIKNLYSDISENKIPFNNQTLPTLDFYNENKIIGIGETLHGNSIFNKLTFKLLKQQIKHGSTKLVMFEMPVDLVMHWNLFVEGASDDSISNFIPTILINPKDLAEFLLWVRNYNSNTEKQVKIFGIDIAGQCKDDYYLKKYISTLPSSRLVDSLKSNLGGFDIKTYQKANTLLNKHQEYFIEVMGQQQFLYFSQALKGKAGLVRNPDLSNKIGETRDYILAQNALFAINNLCPQESQAIIYAHIGHLTPKPFYYTGDNLSPMGAILKEKFGKDYAVLGLLAATGTYSAKQGGKYISNASLSIPPQNSLENICLKKINNLFFYEFPQKKRICNLVKLRNTGHYALKKQFFFTNPALHFDAFIFAEKSEGFKIPENWNKNQDMLSKMKQLIRKNKKY